MFSKADLNYKNNLGLTCFEAYASQHGVDEAATYLEQAAQKQKCSLASTIFLE